MINLTSFLSYHQLDELCSRKSKLVRGIAKEQVEQGIILIRRVTDIGSIRADSTNRWRGHLLESKILLTVG